MPYSVKSQKTGTTYYLHRTKAKTRSGERLLHFFSKEVKEGAIDAVPAGYTVVEAPTGLPLLKRK
jgi:hypothetical protein